MGNGALPEGGDGVGALPEGGDGVGASLYLLHTLHICSLFLAI